MPNVKIPLKTVLGLIDDLDVVKVQCSEMSLQGTVESISVMISQETANKLVSGIEDENGYIKIWIDA